MLATVKAARIILAALGLALAAGALALPDPWRGADAKAGRDAGRLAALTGRPDRIGWRMSEDPAMYQAMAWDAEGTPLYPPPDGVVPLAYAVSEDAMRQAVRFQGGLRVAGWTRFGTSDDRLLFCDPDPALCVVYDRTALEAAVGVRPGALATARRDVAWLLPIALGLLGAAVLPWRRRAPASEDRRRTADGGDAFTVDPSRLSARRGALEVALTARDVKVLAFLQGRDGAVATKDELYDAGWGRDYMPNSRALDQHILILRRKLDPDRTRPPLIETVRGVGYRLVR